jgi:cytochrome c oxidase subunit II
VPERCLLQASRTGTLLASDSTRLVSTTRLLATLVHPLAPDSHSALDPAGPQAAHIAELSWLFIAVCTLVWLIVVAFFVVALFRRRNVEVMGDDPPASYRSKAAWVLGGAVLTGLIIYGLIFASVRTGTLLASLVAPDALVVEVVGDRWWWEVRYHDPLSDRLISTANEMVIPAGEPVVVRLASRDVIHSLWIPRLHGKRDLMPGQRTYLTIQADEPGSFRGFCAEFCGIQHALMGFLVIAVPRAEFDAWLAHQAGPAVPPADPLQMRGRELFFSSGCASCHLIRGEQRAVSPTAIGPDLTHLATRRTLAAGTVPNTAGHLAGWISDPDGTKPGSLMPPTRLEPADLHALVAYLQILK